MARRSRWALGAIAATALLAATPASEAAAASLLIDAGTGAVIFADAPNHLWYPASLTKIMTVYLALGEIKAGRMSFDDKIIVSRKAATVTPVRFGLAAGQKITVRQAINAAIVASANDAAVALAEKIGGTEENFADIMTVAARGIGMTRTTFRNATGLPDAHQVTTAHDMALLAMMLLRDHASHYSLFNQRSVTIGGKSRGTVNGILGSYEGADGIKTGFTCGSGYNLVASAMRGKRRVIGVVLGSGSRQQRRLEMTKLLDAGWARDAAPKEVLSGDLLASAFPRDVVPGDAFPGIRLATLLVSAEDEGGPPVVLSGPKCQAMGEYEEEVAETAESASGWSIIFGSYTDKAKAQMALAEARGHLVIAGNAGRATIAAKSRNGGSTYSPMIVDLTKSAAVTACKTLSAKKLSCLAEGPVDLGIGAVALR